MGQTVEVEIYMKEYFITEKVSLKNGEQLHVNDEVQQVDHQPITGQLLQSAGKPVKLTVKRGAKIFTVNCNALEWRLIQQKLSNITDGIGTLTYVTEDLKHFGALGHKIQLRNNGQFDSGFIHLATIQSVVKSEKNTPGYKIIHPTLALRKIGQLHHNNSVGIFGGWEQQLKLQHQALPTVENEQIAKGKAVILTQISQSEVEQFTIEITKIEGQQFYFTVVDDTLIRKTGGVIQGMSGSPIIQGEQIIGAVTHMFVEDPKKGVAITINTMLEKSNS